MDGTAARGEQVEATARTTVRARLTGVRLLRERPLSPRSAPRFFLSYLLLPNDGTDPATPLGTCLVLRSVGGSRPRRVVVDLPGGTTRTAERLPTGAAVGIATPVELPRLVELGTVFVEWEARDGVRRTAWVRVPPVPARYRGGTPSQPATPPAR